MPTTDDAQLPGDEQSRSDVVYHWLRSADTTAVEAEDLTIEVFRRFHRREPTWITGRSVDLRLHFYAVQVVLERRRLLTRREDEPEVRGPA